MQYLIFSDSHGNPMAMKKVIDRCICDTDGIIFLGDNIRDIEQLGKLYPELKFYSVAGNCDVSLEYLKPEYQEKVLELDGIRVLITHGHQRSVKFYLGELCAYAKRADCDVVLFGHTHERVCESRYGQKPSYIFNPGSVSRPRDGLPASFGVLTVRNGQILLSHGEIDPRKDV